MKQETLFKIRPLRDIHLLGTDITIYKDKEYCATYATNQPHWQALELVFVNEILLSKDDYEVVG